MQSTRDSDVDTLLDELLCRMREAIGGTLVGLYLYGSLITGDFDQEISDLDLLAVTTLDVGGGTFRTLHRMHNAFIRKHTAWEDRLDITYISTAALRTFGTHPSTVAVISPGEPFHEVEATTDWLMNWYLVREHGRTLFGPPPATFIRAISKNEFIEVVREHAQHWSAWIDQTRTRKAQAYAILTMCRALYAHRNGEHVSKKQAALWAEQELSEWAPLIENARLWRAAWRDEDVDHATTLPETRRFVRFIIRRIAAG